MGRSGPQGSRGVSAAGCGLVLEAEPHAACAGTGLALLEGRGCVAFPARHGESFKLFNVWVRRSQT